MEVRVAVAGAGRRLAGQVRVTFESAQSDPTKLAQLDVEVTTQLAEPRAQAGQRFLQILRVSYFGAPFLSFIELIIRPQVAWALRCSSGILR